MGAIATPAGAPLGLVNVSAAAVPLSVTAAASQSADLQQWLSSTSVVLANVNSAGLINDASGIGPAARLFSYHTCT